MARAFPPTVPDLVHAHTPLECALAGRRSARLLGVPLLYEIHTPYADEVGQRRRPGIPAGWYLPAKRLARAREADVARSADTVVVQTGILGRRIAELFRLDEARVAVVPNGIDGRLFDPEPWTGRRNEIRRERGWTGKRIVLYSGYLDWINGVDFLLEAGNTLSAATRRNARIVLAGDGPLAEAAQRRAATDPGLYEYLGRVEAPSMPELYAGADIFVIPRPDTPAGRNLIPIKLLEAMAMEKAVLASDLDAIREALGEDGCGLRFRPGDREDFRQRLESLVERFDDMGDLGKNARGRALTAYGWERSRKLLADIYRNLGRTDSSTDRTEPS